MLKGFRKEVYFLLTRTTATAHMTRIAAITTTAIMAPMGRSDMPRAFLSTLLW